MTPSNIFVCLIICLFLLTTGKAFSQSSEKENTNSTINTQSGANPQYVKGITPGRARSLAGVGLGLISLIVGWRAKALSSKLKGGGRTGATIALSLAVISITLSIIHLANSAGAVFGSGSGKAGAIFAIILSAIGLTLGALTLRRKTV